MVGTSGLATVVHGNSREPSSTNEETSKDNSSPGAYFFELGAIRVLDRTILCEEITVGVTTELTPRFVSDQKYPVDLEPHKKGIEFTLKKPKILEQDLLFFMVTHDFSFDIQLYRILELPRTYSIAEDIAISTVTGSMGTSGMSIDLKVDLQLILKGCTIRDLSFGKYDGTQIVTEDVTGNALYYEFPDSHDMSAGYMDILQRDYSNAKPQ